MPVELVSVGEAFEDLIFHGLTRLPRPGEELRAPSFARTSGGGAIITAIAAARLGLDVRVLGTLPEVVRARLARERIPASDLARRGERSAVSVALSTPRDRAFVTFDGVNADLEDRLLSRFLTRLPRARHVHFALGPRQPSAWVGVVGRLRSRGTSTSWDFGWHETLPRRRGFRTLLAAIDWVMVNEREAEWYAQAPTWALTLERWPVLAKNVVIKRGGRGALATMSGASPVTAAAPRVTVVDTTGAGDAFNGGFLAALVRGAPVAEALGTGVVVGSLSVRAAGGVDGLPTATELRVQGVRVPAATRRRQP